MRCHDYEVLIAMHIEGDLAGRKLELVLKHLDCCASCQRFAEELTASQRILKSLRDEPLDERTLQTLPDRVTERIVLTNKESPISAAITLLHRMRWQLLWSACMLALVAILIIPLRTRQQVPDRGILERGEHSATRLQASPEPASQARLGQPSTAPESKTVKTLKGYSRLTSQPKSDQFRTIQPRKEGLSPYTAELKAPIQVPAREQGSGEMGIVAPSLSMGSMTLTGREDLPTWPPTTQTATVEFPEPPVDQMVIKLVTDDPNIVIVWLVDQKRGKENAEN